MTDVVPGSIIYLADGRLASVKFIGSTHFADGEWIGVELEEPTGKNDGAVQGERYFDCEQGYGMFIRPSAVSEILETPSPQVAAKKEVKPAPARPAAGTNGAASRPRPTSGIGASAGVGGLAANKRTSLLSSTAAKRQSLNAASPTPGARGMAPPRTLRVSLSLL